MSHNAHGDCLEKVIGQMGNWIIVETTEELDSAIDYLKAESGEWKFLATSPDVLQALQDLGIKPRGLHEFTSDEELNELALRNFEASQEAMGVLSKVWLEIMPDIAEEYDPFQATLFNLKRAADAATFRLRELLNFSQEVSPTSIAVVARPSKVVPEENYQRQYDIYSVMFDPDDSVTAWLSRFDAWSHLSLHWIPHLYDAPTLRRNRSRIMWKNLVGNILNRNRVLGGRFLKDVRTMSLRRNPQGRLLIIRGDESARSFSTYAWRELNAEIDWWTEMDSNPIVVSTLRSVNVSGRWKMAPEHIKRLETELDRLSQGDHWVVDGNASAQKVIVARLRDFVHNRLPYLVNLFARAVRYIEKRNPIAVLSGASGSDFSHTISQASSKYGVPFVVFQHGGCYGYCYLPTLNYSDLSSSHIFASWGSGVSSDLASQMDGMGREVRFIDIGWPYGPDHPLPLFSSGGVSGSPKIRADAKRATVLYVTTGLHGNQRYGPYHSHNDISYVLHQRDVVDALSRSESMQVIVKTHYKDSAVNPLSKYVAEAGYDRVKVLHQGPMVQLLDSVDVVVIDYVSTTLLQALGAGKPVVVVNSGVHRYTAKGELALKEATEWVEKEDGWQGQVVMAIERALKRADRPEECRFLAEYGNGLYRPQLLWEAIQDYSSHGMAGVG